MNDLQVTLLPPERPAPPALEAVFRVSRLNRYHVEVVFLTPDGMGAQRNQLSFCIPAEVARTMGQTLIAYATEANR